MARLYNPGHTHHAPSKEEDLIPLIFQYSDHHRMGDDRFAGRL
jgi:hypothetical protein